MSYEPKCEPVALRAAMRIYVKSFGYFVLVMTSIVSLIPAVVLFFGAFFFEEFTLIAVVAHGIVALLGLFVMWSCVLTAIWASGKLFSLVGYGR